MAEPPPTGPRKPPAKVHLSPEANNVCLCFHVPLNKLTKHIRLTNPRHASQLSECFGAGTGCGWCIPFLERIFEQMRENPDATPDIGLDYEEYVARRREYHKRIDAGRMRDTPGDGEAAKKKTPPES
jgi:bacterioferritin-associated ferredoxin